MAVFVTECNTVFVEDLGGASAVQDYRGSESGGKGLDSRPREQSQGSGSGGRPRVPSYLKSIGGQMQDLGDVGRKRGREREEGRDIEGGRERIVE